ncbi:MAG: hypothetical protein H7A08_04875 [Oceanospirillaceae bacterium]|nr:hypothetical protein [Oceanospirillaceae bacterium]
MCCTNTMGFRKFAAAINTFAVPLGHRWTPTTNTISTFTGRSDDGALVALMALVETLVGAFGNNRCTGGLLALPVQAVLLAGVTAGFKVLHSRLPAAPRLNSIGDGFYFIREHIADLVAAFCKSSKFWVKIRPGFGSVYRHPRPFIGEG